MTMKTNLRAAVVTALLAALAGCAQSDLRMSPDFGRAVSQDLAAQIADPDAHYLGTPAPGSDGARVGLAQERYQANAVIQPATTTASSSTKGGIDNGAGASAGASAGTSK